MSTKKVYCGVLEYSFQSMGEKSDEDDCLHESNFSLFSPLLLSSRRLFVNLDDKRRPCSARARYIVSNGEDIPRI